MERLVVTGQRDGQRGFNFVVTCQNNGKGKGTVLRREFSLELFVFVVTKLVIFVNFETRWHRDQFKLFLMHVISYKRNLKD